MTQAEEVALYPEPGDVVRLRCGHVSYTITDPFPDEGGGIVVKREAVEGGELVVTTHCVGHQAWRDLVRYASCSVERAADQRNVLATPGGGS